MVQGTVQNIYMIVNTIYLDNIYYYHNCMSAKYRKLHDIAVRAQRRLGADFHYTQQTLTISKNDFRSTSNPESSGSSIS